MVLVALWAAGSVAAVVGALAAIEIVPPDGAHAASANLRHLWPFWLASASGWAALSAMWLLLRRREPGRRRGAALVVLGVAALARLAVLATGEPALSDDVYRYVFDGRNLAGGINPYLVTPAGRAEALRAGGPESWPGERALLGLINNPRLHTIYLPASEWVFGAAGLLVVEPWSGPQAGARVMRAVMSLFDLAVMGGLLVALARRGRSTWWLALYAWHPLPLAEIAGSGHQESLGTALLVAALLLGSRAAARPWRWSAVLALTTMVKPVVLPVAAFLLKGRRWQAWAASAAAGAVVCAAVAAPLWLPDGGAPLRNLVATAARFQLKWAHFGGVYEPLLAAIEWARPQWTNDGQELLARWICLALVAAIAVALWLGPRPDPWRAARAVLLAMVLLSPAAHPWYLLWALVLVPVVPSPAVWIASLTLPWGYAAWADPQWKVSPWVIAAAYVPVYAALAVGVVVMKLRSDEVTEAH